MTNSCKAIPLYRWPLLFKPNKGPTNRLMYQMITPILTHTRLRMGLSIGWRWKLKCLWLDVKATAKDTWQRIAK